MTESVFQDQEPTIRTVGKMFDGKKRPSGKWMIFMVGVTLLGAVIVIFMLGSSQDTYSAGNAQATAINPNERDLEVGGKGTAEYNRAIIEQSLKSADIAASNGQSFSPTPVSNDTVSALNVKPEQSKPKPKPNAQQKQRNQQEISEIRRAVELALAGVLNGMEMRPQTTMNFVKSEEMGQQVTDREAGGHQVNLRNQTDTEGAGVTVASKTIRLPNGIHAGSILYAVNDLRLNSDGKNPVVRATIAAGPLNHYTAIGAFENGGESLSLVFHRLISPNGTEYTVEAYGIDPTVPQANVASDVDYHTLSRWGGFMAATFLSGFADATRMSGISSNTGYNNGIENNGLSNYAAISIPTYTLMQKGAIAVGEVGRAVGEELRAGLKRPPTVTLDAGEPIGILIISAGGNK